MKTVDILKDAITARSDRARELIARATDAEDVTEAEAAELVALALLRLGAIKLSAYSRLTTPAERGDFCVSAEETDCQSR